MIFGDWIGRWAGYAPNKLALIDAQTGKRYTYRALAERVHGLAAGLAERGVRKGDRIAVLSYNRPETLELLLAVGRLGAILVPINFRLAEPEIRQIIADATPVMLFAGEEFEGVVARAGITSVTFSRDYEIMIIRGAEPPKVEIAAEDAWIILYTSGTTGRPKGAVLTHGSVTWNAVNTAAGWDLHHDDVTLTHTPFFHTGGLNVLTTPLLHRGGTVVLMRAFEAAESLQLIAQHRITVVFAVPTMFEMMRDADGFASADLSSIRFFITGGAPCSVSLIEAYAARGVPFKQGYGLTEAGPNCFTLDAKEAVRKAGSVGFPNLHVDVRIVDETGEEVDRGCVGELWIRGPHVFKGYWNAEAATAEAFEGDWLKTGDLVWRDDEGFTYIAGRKKDLIISGGENIYPAEIECLLVEHPAVKEAAVIGMPDARWGEVGRAIVVLKEGFEAEGEELLAFLSGRAAKYKIPKSAVLADTLPRNASGKILKAALREQFADASLACP